MSAALGGLAQGLSGGMQSGMQMAKLGKDKNGDEKNAMADGMGATQEPVAKGEMGDSQVAGEGSGNWELIGSLMAARSAAPAAAGGAVQGPAVSAMAAPVIAKVAKKHPEAAAATAMGGPGAGLTALALDKANDKGWLKGLLG